MPQSSIHRILARGRGYAPERRTIDRLAAALGTTPHWLSDGMQPFGTPAALDATPGPQPGSPRHAAQLEELDALLSHLTAADLEKLLEAARLIAPRQASPIEMP